MFSPLLQNVGFNTSLLATLKLLESFIDTTSACDRQFIFMDFRKIYFSRFELLKSVSPIIQKNILAGSPLFNYIFTKIDF